MISLVKTICSKGELGDNVYKDTLDALLEAYENYKNQNEIYIFTELEYGYLNYLKEVYDRIYEFPTIELFCDDNGVELAFMDKADEIKDYRSLKIYTKSIIDLKLKTAVSNEIANIAISGEDKLPENKERINTLLYLQDKVERSYTTKFDFEGYYQDRLKRPVGMKWPSRVLNDKAGEMAEGEISVIAGFTSHMKTTLAMNIVHNNVFEGGYNIVYFTLETSKESMWTNLISRHSIGLDEVNGISAKKVRRLVLNDDEYGKFQKANAHWEENRAGNLFFIDEMDMSTKDPREFREILEEIDDLLGGNLHGFVIDYIQILKNTNHSNGKSDSKAVGDYMEMFRSLTQGFRKGTKYEKKLTGIILSQIKRESAERAANEGGRYFGPSCMSDSSELEKSAHVVVSTYTDLEMKANKQALVQVLKARNGEVSEPEIVTITGDTYFYGDSEILEDGMTFDEMGSNDLGELIDGALSDINNLADNVFGGSSLW